MTYQLPMEIIHEEELWMARSSAIQGFLATGETLDQLLHEVPTIVQSLYEICLEKGWTFIKDAPHAQPKDIVWVIELPHPILQAA
jgi:hypothetical protein